MRRVKQCVGSSICEHNRIGTENAYAQAASTDRFGKGMKPQGRCLAHVLERMIQSQTQDSYKRRNKNPPPQERKISIFFLSQPYSNDTISNKGARENWQGQSMGQIWQGMTEVSAQRAGARGLVGSKGKANAGRGPSHGRVHRQAEQQ